MFRHEKDDDTTMTDKKPEPVTPPRLSSRGLVLPPNGRDVTAEKVGSVVTIIGAATPKAYPK
jgi:hypothetical protein